MTDDSSKPESPELLEMGSHSSMRANAPFLISVYDLRELETLADSWNQTMQSSNGLRQIVLDSWLLVDFWARITLCAAFGGLINHSTPELDLRYELLPQSHDRCLALIQRLYTAHSKLPDVRPISSVTGTTGFWGYLYRQHRPLFDQLMTADNAYLEDIYGPAPSGHPAWVLSSHMKVAPLSERPPNKIPNNWLDLVGRLDEAWYRKARRLNNARNEAAHSTSHLRILAAFGVHGENAIERAKAECRELIGTLLGITSRESAS
jgi:hypothetical protein